MIRWQHPYRAVGAVMLAMAIAVSAVSLAVGRGVAFEQVGPHRGGTGSRVTTTAASQCPAGSRPSKGAAGPAVASVQRKRRQIFRDIDSRGSDVFAVASLDPASGEAPGIDLQRYLRIARRACGDQLARRSWAVFVHLPQAPMASTADAVALTALTGRGWLPWYLIYPAFGTSGFVT
jgi:hypothetical protein